MIEQDLHVLKETEMECRRILEQAQQERLRILHAAQQEAIKRHDTLLRDALAQCEHRLKQETDGIVFERDARLKQCEEQVWQLQEKARGRVQDAVSRIFEGMWTNGDCTDDQLRADDA